MKRPFVTKEQVENIVKKYPTPFHLYDEEGIRKNAEEVKKAFSWNKGFREYFAVKATPNPYILKILNEYDCGCDCSSYTELMLSKAIGVTGHHIMFSSNDTPKEEFVYADKLGAIINLDDFTDTSDKIKDVYDITCTSSFEVEKKENNESEKSKIYKFIDFNVLINGIDEEPFGFEHLINELKNNDYKVDTE